METLSDSRKVLFLHISTLWQLSAQNRGGVPDLGGRQHRPFPQTIHSFNLTTFFISACHGDLLPSSNLFNILHSTLSSPFPPHFLRLQPSGPCTSPQHQLTHQHAHSCMHTAILAAITLPYSMLPTVTLLITYLSMLPTVLLVIFTISGAMLMLLV